MEGFYMKDMDFHGTAGCYYNSVQYIILHTALQWQSFNSQQSYGVSIVRIMDKIDHVIMAAHCIDISIVHEI